MALLSVDVEAFPRGSRMPAASSALILDLMCDTECYARFSFKDGVRGEFILHQWCSTDARGFCGVDKLLSILDAVSITHRDWVDACKGGLRLPYTATQVSVASVLTTLFVMVICYSSIKLVSSKRKDMAAYSYLRAN